MSRRALIGLLVYTSFATSFVSGLYDPLSSGSDDSGVLVLAVVAMHVAAGVLVARWWVLALPGVVCVLIVAIVAPSDPVAFAALFPGLPMLLAITWLGVLAGRRDDLRPAVLAAGVVAIGVVPGVMASLEWAQRGDPLSAAVQRTLPLSQYTLISGVCLTDRYHPGLAARTRRTSRAQLAALVRQLRMDSDRTVRTSYAEADGPGTGHETMTVRELAENHLGATSGLPGNECETAARERLRDAL